MYTVQKPGAYDQLRYTQGYAPMGVQAQKRWGVHGLGDLTFDGTGLLGTGLFGSSTWGIGEWAVIGLGAIFAFGLIGGKRGGGGLFGSSRADRRRKLDIARAKYELERAEV